MDHSLACGDFLYIKLDEYVAFDEYQMFRLA